MSRTDQGSDQQAIDTILKSLSSRPNVHATLIISRKDGSIIRATGLEESEKRATVNAPAYGNAQANDNSTVTQVASPGVPHLGDAASQDKESITVTQRLAASIYDFVVTSSKLASSIAYLGAQQAGTGTESVPFAKHEEKESRSLATMSQPDDDVQLLRMRTKRHEIIIYPDPNYLCCVVQNIANKDNRSQ